MVAMKILYHPQAARRPLSFWIILILKMWDCNTTLTPILYAL